MKEIELGQTLEINNVLSYRGKVKQYEIENIGREMEHKINERGAKRTGNPITATFGIEGDKLDIELILPIDKNIGSIEQYCFKEKIKIVNALKLAYVGNPSGLQIACNEMNQYIFENKLQPITVGYNVTKHIDPMNIENTEIDVYVGINPNIL